MLSGLSSGLDTFFIWLDGALKKNLSDYSNIETAQDEYTLVASDGSLLSIIRLDGYRSLINRASFYKRVSDPFRSGLDPFMNKRGHSVQIWFGLDPTKSEQVVRKALAPSYETVKRLNLDSLSEILDERVKNISSRANHEECFIILWTNPSSLVKNEVREEGKSKRAVKIKQKAPHGTSSSDPLAANNALINSHHSFVENIDQMLFSIGLAAEKLSAADAVRAIRASVDSNMTSDKWEPVLPGDPIHPNIRRVTPRAEQWDIVWPKLSWQICPSDAKIVSDNMIEVGDNLYAPGYVDLLPKEIKPFGELFGSIGGKYPWRILITIEGDGMSAIQTRGIFASILGFTSGNNKLLSDGVKTLKEMRDSFNQTVVKTRVAFCTWGHKSKTFEVEKQFSEMCRAVESWGGCLVSKVTGDPAAGFMSSSCGATNKSVATVSAAPLGAMTFMMPLSRPTSAWESGAVLFTSPDAKLIPYQPTSSEQTTWVQLIFAKPGSGKSLLMNVMNLGACQGGGLTRLPKIGIVDIGPSSSGLISLIKESLPPEKRHLAQYYRMRMTEDFCVNPFDTQLGCRFPTAEESSFLKNFLLLLVTDPNKEQPEEGMAGLVGAVVEDMYRKKSDRERPTRYDYGIDKRVDDALKDIAFAPDHKTSWWEVVDALFLADRKHEAMIAQRFAVPLLSDASASAQDDKINEIYGRVQTVTGETLVQYFSRSIVSVLDQYKILARPTVFDIGESRIISLDLDEVAKSGGVQAQRQTAVMYLLARYILGKDYKLNAETVNELPYPAHIEAPSTVPVQEYKNHHKRRIEESREDLKRLCYDEFHRTSSSERVRHQVIEDMREGRKWNIDVTLSSQTVLDFDETMKSFATSIFIMDGGNEKDIENIVSTFGVEDDAEKQCLSSGIVRGPRNGRAGVFMAKFFTNKGKFTQLLSVHIGPTEFWALTTTAEDAVIRGKLYERVGPAEARRILAKNYPFGIKKVVEQRKENMKATGSYTDDDSNIYNQLVQELLEKSSR